MPPLVVFIRRGRKEALVSVFDVRRVTVSKDPTMDAIRAADKVPATWYPRSHNPPAGKVVWATDGVLVWPIVTDGFIPPDATLVRAWTDAFIPEPPKELPR